MSENLEQHVLVFRYLADLLCSVDSQNSHNALCSFTADEGIFSVPYNLIPLIKSALN